MNPQIRQALTAIGLVDINASDAQVAQAWAQYQQQNPQGAQEIMQQSGMGGMAQALPWLTIIGVVGGAVALYFVWQHYSGRKQVASFEADDEDDDDPSPRLHAMSRSLRTFKALGAPKRMSGCPGPRRMGKYQFEPELKLEGYRRKR